MNLGVSVSYKAYFRGFIGFLTVLALGVAQGYAATPDVFPIPGAGFGPMRPVVADLDGDPANGKESVVTTSDGTVQVVVQVVTSSGAPLWAARTPNVDCAATPLNDKMHSSAVVGDLFGNGELYVVAGYGGYVAAFG